MAKKEDVCRLAINPGPGEVVRFNKHCPVPAGFMKWLKSDEGWMFLRNITIESKESANG